MPGCAAVGCNNRSEKGYIMKCFPRDPKLRKIWQERVARADWEPSNNSFLCHVHFEPEEWSITQSGRIRLKKNAVPSIFTITSTRKSHKKRIKLANMKNEKECENDYITEHLENDTEHSSTGHLEEKDSDSQDVDDPIQSFAQRVNDSLKKTKNKVVPSKQYRGITSNLQQENILISEANAKLEDNINDYNSRKQVDVGNENPANNQNKNVKTEIKGEIDQMSLDSYDEIEEKLKQICDGYREESNSNIEKLNSISKNEKEILEKSVIQMPFHRSINYKYSSKDKGNILMDNTENIEIIFGSESGEEYVRVPRSSHNETNEIDKLDQCITDINNTTKREIDKTCLKTTEKSFNRENIHVTSNIKAAMKRKWRTREEIMKSIKKSIRITSSQDTNLIGKSDISNNMEMENKIGKELNASESILDKNDTTLTKFTIRVTGEREDIIDIMEDLFKDTKDFTIQEHSNVHTHQANNILVTSVVTIDDCTWMEANAKDKSNHDILPSSIASITSTSNDQTSSDLLTLKNDKCPNTKLMPSHFNEELNDRNINSDCLSLDINNVTGQLTSNTIKCEYQKLQQKVKMQEDVIKKLTSQLILYKDLEKDLKKKNIALDIKTMMNEFTKTDNTSSSMSCKKNMDLRESLIDELSNRASYFQEMNKKLMKSVTVECQQKRELESQIKQKDNLIKELNWKLQKASKFLDRAEKNTNTYKRKMLNMKTFIRRKKFLDEKVNKFNELLINSVKGDYSEKALAMAMEIKETCGTNGYDKLLSFGFPLPSLSALQILQSDDFSDSNESSVEVPRSILSKRNINEEFVLCMKNNVKVDTKNYSKIPETICGEIVLDSAETVTGTVQDIFEESNDVDDFSTNELKEHFISELNVTM